MRTRFATLMLVTAATCCFACMATQRGASITAVWSIAFRETHRVIAVDHLGCGRSDKPPRGAFPYTLAAHRDNLVALIDSLDLRNITLIAHDWGGAIGLTSLLERQERFDRIVLLNTGAFPPPYVPWRIAACRIPLLGTAAVRGLNAFARAAITMAMSRNKMDADVARGLLAPYDNWDNRVAIDAFVRDIPAYTESSNLCNVGKVGGRSAKACRHAVTVGVGNERLVFPTGMFAAVSSGLAECEVGRNRRRRALRLEDAPEETLECDRGVFESESRWRQWLTRWT